MSTHMQIPSPIIDAHPVDVHDGGHKRNAENSIAGAEDTPRRRRQRQRARRRARNAAAAQAVLREAYSHDLASSALPSASTFLPQRTIARSSATILSRGSAAGYAGQVADDDSAPLDGMPAFAADLGSTPFSGNDDSSMQPLPEAQSLPLLVSRAQAFSSLGSLDTLLPPHVDLTLERADSRLPPIRLRRRARAYATQVPRGMRRQATWAGGMNGHSHRWTTDGLPEAEPARHASGDREGRGMQMSSRSFVARMVPGSLSMHTLREQSSRPAEDLLALAPLSLRTKSQPTLVAESLPVDREEVLRRSSSIHSIPARPDSRSASQIEDGRGELTHHASG
jgi:hypothetical protein